MRRGNKKLITISGITVLALLGWWLTNSLSPAKKIAESSQLEPDYYINDIVITALDISGKRKYILKARRMTHSPADDTSDLDFPELTQFNKGGTPVFTTANHGHLSADKKKIVMTGQVRMINVTKKDAASNIITSKKLTIILE